MCIRIRCWLNKINTEYSAWNSVKTHGRLYHARESLYGEFVTGRKSTKTYNPPNRKSQSPPLIKHLNIDEALGYLRFWNMQKQLQQ